MKIQHVLGIIGATCAMGLFLVGAYYGLVLNEYAHGTFDIAVALFILPDES